MSRFISDALNWLSDAKDAFGDMATEIGSATKEFASEIGDIAVDAAGEMTGYVVENPGECAAVAMATVATGGVAFVAAPVIAATAGGFGLLGAASTGTVISSLSGAASSPDKAAGRIRK